MLLLLRLRRIPFPTRIRLLHASARTCHLIGPPDPVSHIRPIIYDDAPPLPPPSSVGHPYSLFEFTPGHSGYGDDLDLQWKLQRQELDALHQNFWTDSNTRFEAAKQAVITSLPESSTPLDKEDALSEFYKQWVVQETARTNEYTNEWRKRNVSGIMLGVRVEYQKFISRLSRITTFGKST